MSTGQFNLLSPKILQNKSYFIYYTIVSGYHHDTMTSFYTLIKNSCDFEESNYFYDSSLKFIPLDQSVKTNTLHFEFHLLCTGKMRVDMVYDNQRDEICEVIHCEVIPQICVEFNWTSRGYDT